MAMARSPAPRPQRCPTCQGTGEIRRVQQSIFGQFVNVMVCDRCRGEGRIITTPCERCHGQGRVRNVRRVTVNIPAGVDDGINVRVTGEGEAPPRGGTPGNLFVALTVKPHEYFKRQGSDILYELPVSFAEAALGAEVEVPTLDGKETLKIPPGTQSGRVFRLKGKGVPVVHSNTRGDELVTVKIVTPQIADHAPARTAARVRRDRAAAEREGRTQTSSSAALRSSKTCSTANEPDAKPARQSAPAP